MKKGDKKGTKRYQNIRGQKNQQKNSLKKRQGKMTKEPQRKRQKGITEKCDKKSKKK